MNARASLIFALCLVLVCVRIVGTHTHLVRSHTSSGSTVSVHQDLVVEDEDSPLHLLSHLGHGDIDADDTVQSVSKFAALSADLAPALVLFVLFVLCEPSGSLLRPQRPELRPPPRRRVFDLTPPSHAPPCRLPTV